VVTSFTTQTGTLGPGTVFFSSTRAVRTSPHSQSAHPLLVPQHERNKPASEHRGWQYSLQIEP
jgi:hypothetical protein